MAYPVMGLVLALKDLPAIDWVIIAFYLVGVLAIGMIFSRFVHSSTDFLLAGKSLPFWAVGMSVVVSDIGAIDMMAGAGAAYRYGIAQANFDWLGSVPAMIIVAFVFVPLFWRSGVATLPAFLGRRYGNTVRNIQSVIWLGFLISMLAVMLWMSAKFLDTVLGLPTWQGVWLTVFIVGIYTVLGGLTAVVMTDVIQTVILFVGAGALLILSFWKIGGWDAMVTTVTERGPEFAQRFQLLLPNDAETPYPWSGIVFGLGIVLSTAYFSSNQAVIQRVLGARSEWHAKASLLFAAFLKLLIPVLLILPGLTALALHPELQDPDQAVPQLVAELLPPGVLGLVFASFFAALMSSVDSYLNSSTTIIISDIWRPLIGTVRGAPPSDRSCLVLGRVLTFGLIVAAGLIAPVIERFETLYTAMQTLFSIFQGPTLALLFLGVLWRRTNSKGAAFGLITGVLLSSALSLVGDRIFPSEDPFLYVAFWTFIWSLAVTVLVSLLTKPPPESQTLGLVWGAMASDAETQAVLRERLGKAGFGDADDPYSRAPFEEDS